MQVIVPNAIYPVILVGTEGIGCTYKSTPLGRFRDVDTLERYVTKSVEGNAYAASSVLHGYDGYRYIEEEYIELDVIS